MDALYKVLLLLLILSLRYIATECGPLIDPINGRVTFNGIVVYSIGTYECDSGFGIKGAVSRMCRKDGTWSGSNPSCERMLTCTCIHTMLTALVIIIIIIIIRITCTFIYGTT